MEGRDGGWNFYVDCDSPVQCRGVTVSSTANVYSCVVLPVNIVERDGAINSI